MRCIRAFRLARPRSTSSPRARACESEPEGSRSKVARSEKSVEKRRRFIRDADDLIGRLTIEFEIELGLRLSVVSSLRRTSAHCAPSGRVGERIAPDRHAHPAASGVRLRLSGRAPPQRRRRRARPARIRLHSRSRKETLGRRWRSSCRHTSSSARRRRRSRRADRRSPALIAKRHPELSPEAGRRRPVAPSAILEHGTCL